MGSSHHDAIKVPFILLPNAQNEGQFAFTVHEIKVAQKLKGTLTYILKVNIYIVHALDFKLMVRNGKFMYFGNPQLSKFFILTQKQFLWGYVYMYVFFIILLVFFW